MLKRKIFPVLKWAGGKTQILERIIDNMPKQYDNYYEPFIGGGSVLLGVSPIRAFINDVNEQLINLYIQLQNSADSVIEILHQLDAIPCNNDYYYKIRQKYNLKIADKSFDTECAALLIWLNNHCFNGLYRVNRKGFFNVPFNNKIHGKSFNENHIRLLAEYLRNSDITIQEAASAITNSERETPDFTAKLLQATLKTDEYKQAFEAGQSKTAENAR